MSWEIDREGLHEFIDEAIDAIASTPLPMEIVEALIADDAPDEIREATYREWIAAGLAVIVGMTIRNDPERFLIETP